MMSNFEVVHIEDDNSVRVREVEADRFEIVEGGVLAFYKNDVPDLEQDTSLGSLKSDDQPFLAFREWDEVEQQ